MRLVTSGTQALEVALRSIGVGPGNEVVLPAWTFHATAAAVARVGASVRFADVARANHCLGVEEVEAAWSEAVKAVVVVLQYGQVVNLQALYEHLAPRGVELIVDAAPALGASLAAQGALDFCAAAVLSFAYNKNVTCGEGGAVLTNSDEIARFVQRDRNHGRLPGSVEHTTLGGNLRLSELLAAILPPQIDRLGDQVGRKREFVSQLYEEFMDAFGQEGPYQLAPGIDVQTASHFAVPVQVNWEMWPPNLPLARVNDSLRAEGVPVAPRTPRSVASESSFKGRKVADSLRVCEELERTTMMLGQPAMSAVGLTPFCRSSHCESCPVARGFGQGDWSDHDKQKEASHAGAGGS
ncbi:DegT/DnrJ/EryC1/StrS family aminotransferase, partial [Parenemella sanctibonifatiensis]|uniref:DegT/DnrJ/EryC1/StrS family aminotransferase n=1 Tax=Parenemella sanctibonifatiensis TaxID=2016505 RepID=UPI001E553F10